MSKQKLTLIVLALILVGTSGFADYAEPVMAVETIYIRADGNVDPPTAPVSTTDKVLYTLTSNLDYSIVIEIDNMVFDGMDHVIQGAAGLGSVGISLSGRNNITVRNTGIHGFGFGIRLDNSKGIWVVGNSIANNYYGIGLYGFSADNSIIGNNVEMNSYGITIGSSTRTSIFDNNITASSYDGIQFWQSSNNSVLGNSVTANKGDGIYLYASSDNSIAGNNIIANKGDGITFCYPVGTPHGSSNNSITGNRIATNTRDGIRLCCSSSHNSISENTIESNSVGIGLVHNITQNSMRHNNFVNNTRQAYDYWHDNPAILSSANVWDDGYPSGGNYWSGYNGADLLKGFYQNETGSDGIGDTPYTIDGNNTDLYPLMKPYTTESLLTDLNKDGKVNVLDITVVALAYGSKPGEPKWNIEADMDSNGLINILDVSMVAKDYGKTRFS